MYQNKLLTTLVVFLFLFCQVSQLKSQSSFRIGFKAGMHVSSLDEGRYSDYDFFYPGAGYYAGITLDKEIHSKWDINLELLFVRRVAKEKYLDESGLILDYEISDHRIKSTSLMIPVTVNYAIDRLNIQSGLFTEYYLQRARSGNPHHELVANLAIDNIVNAGIIIGGHYDFYNLEVGMRKLMGFVNHAEIMINEDGINEMIDLYKTDDLQFYVKYLF